MELPLLKNDNMHGYKEFFDDVKKTFMELIQQDKSVLTCFSDQTFGNYSIELAFEKSTLCFDLDRMDLQVYFKSQDHIEKFYIIDIINILHPKVITDTPCEGEVETRNYIICQLRFLSNLITNHLRCVINGDFSWREIYIQKSERDKELISRVLKLDYNNPIYQKFRNGDNSWKEDII